MRPAYKHLFLLLSLLIGLCFNNAWAAESQNSSKDFEHAHQAYQEKNYPLARQLFNPLAEAGDAKAQLYMGGIYEEGLGVERDSVKAVYWFEQSAEQGDQRLQYDLGVRYLYGNGVDKDYNKAIYWWRKAADSGFPEAQYNLGFMYVRGDGVAVDLDKAIGLYQLAAAQGLREAQYAVGLAYTLGQSVPLDFNKAYQLFQLAAKQDYVPAQYNLGVLTESGEGTAVDMNKAIYWYRKAADQGSEMAQQRLAQLESEFGNLDEKHPVVDTTDKQSEQPSDPETTEIYEQAWIKQQPASSYTIQLSLSQNPETLVRWLKSLQLLAPLAYYPHQLKGKVVYKAIYGSFADEQTARKVLSELPADLIKLKPWVRTFSGVHGQLLAE